ncbi:hypothetical protein B5M44_22330 [Shinella sumterensis]|uniref:hypothetical protein n=1 Tax=Shinella sumterensis TaxID=1967501 RepID=UPI00106E843C|nr:hypothetical protein [Shinella sumterensis]MCD1266968.1 hypothetical protein [Shinella sumterensis]TFE95187.1 hypothetical protein B5M44_22330 [Shinella sumterensis]
MLEPFCLCRLSGRKWGQFSAGAGLPDIADAKDWIFDGTVEKDALPSDVVKAIEANGHAFRDMD